MSRPARLPGIALALVVLLLAACAGPQPRVRTAATWEEHSAQLKDLANWTAEGKLALRTPRQSESASLTWHQHGVISRLQISGPLGVAATTLYSNGQTLEIRQGDETSTWDLSDTTALERRTGWDLPLLALPHWIKGLPAPEGDIQLMEMGPDPALLQDLEQDAWQIHYETYANFGGLTLPTRLQIQHKDTTVRLIIRDWQLAHD